MVRKRSKESLKRRSEKRIRTIKVNYPTVKKFAPNAVQCKRNTRLKMLEGEALFLKRMFSLEQMDSLNEALSESNHFVFRNNNTRGSKYFYETGEWTAQGHNRPEKDTTYVAGEPCPIIQPLLLPLAERACSVLRKHFEHIVPVLDDLNSKIEEPKPFGDFHLFICPKGKAKMHKDRRDYISFLFLIHSDEGQGGALEIGGSRYCFDWEAGDAVILESSKCYHGTRHYTGDTDHRLVGIFIMIYLWCYPLPPS